MYIKYVLIQSHTHATQREREKKNNKWICACMLMYKHTKKVLVNIYMR